MTSDRVSNICSVCASLTQSALSRASLHHSQTGVHLQPFYLTVPSCLLLSEPHALDASLVVV